MNTTVCMSPRTYVVETLNFYLSFKHIFFGQNFLKPAIVIMSSTSTRARAWSLSLCVGSPPVNRPILLQQSAVHLPSGSRLPSLQGRGLWLVY